MNKNEERLPCPFCGSKNVHLAFLQDDIVAIICHDCGANGPTSTVSDFKRKKLLGGLFCSSSQERAIVQWGARAV